MNKLLSAAILLSACATILLSSCHKYHPPKDCDVMKKKTLVNISTADDAVVFTNMATSGSCSLPAPVADSIYQYDLSGRVADRKSLRYGSVATLSCNDYPVIGYACFKSETSYPTNASGNVSSVTHQMEQAHYTITGISYDNKINPLFDPCNANYFADFAYYRPQIGGTLHPGDSYFPSTLFQFIPLCKNNPTYLKFEALAEPGFDDHIIEITLEYQYCNGYPAVVHITQKNSDIEYMTESTPTVTSSDMGYFIFNYDTGKLSK